MSDTVTFQPGPVPQGLAPVPAYEVPRQVPGTVHGFGSGRFGLDSGPSTGPIYLAPGQAAVKATGTDGFAIASLVTALLGLSLLAVVFGHVALGRTSRSGRSGRGLAVAGLVIGYLSLAATAALVAFGGLGGVLAAVGAA